MKNLNERIEAMKAIAIEKGYKIEDSRTPAFDFIHAVKGNVKIHIASLSHNESKISDLEEFKNDLDNPKDWQHHNPLYNNKANLLGEIYSTFEGKLNVENREGYVISITENNNICMEQYRVMGDAQQGKWIIVPTDKYNSNSNWSPELCLELLCDLADGVIDPIFHGHH